MGKVHVVRRELFPYLSSVNILSIIRPFTGFPATTLEFGPEILCGICTLLGIERKNVFIKKIRQTLGRKTKQGIFLFFF